MMTVLNGEEIFIGDSIPHYQIRTVELALPVFIRTGFNKGYRRHAQRLTGGGGQDEKSGNTVGYNIMAKHRRLSYMSVHPLLESFALGTQKPKVEHINHYHTKDKDMGMSFFHKERPQTVAAAVELAAETTVTAEGMDYCD